LICQIGWVLILFGQREGLSGTARARIETSLARNRAAADAALLLRDQLRR
jgi:hypothetical protein